MTLWGLLVAANTYAIEAESERLIAQADQMVVNTLQDGSSVDMTGLHR